MTAALRVIDGGAAAPLAPAVVRGRVAECRAILGGARDPFAALWNFRASVKDRRLLLAMAGASMADAARWKLLSWGDLRPAVRGDIKRGLRRFRGWAAVLEGGEQ